MTLTQYAARMGVRSPYVSRLKRDGRIVSLPDGRIDVAATDRRLAESIDWPLELARGPGKIARALQRLGVVQGPPAVRCAVAEPSGGEGDASDVSAADPAVGAGATCDEAVAVQPGGPGISQQPLRIDQDVGGVASVVAGAGARGAVNREPPESNAVEDGRVDGDVGALTAARIVKEQAAAQTAQLTLRKMLGELVAVADVERELGSLLRGLRESLLALVDRLAPLLAAEYDEARIRVLLRAEMRAALNELANRANDAPGDVDVGPAGDPAFQLASRADSERAGVTA